MKTLLRIYSLALGIVCLVPLNAHAYFDPHVGRWASRDPLEEHAFQSQYIEAAPLREKIDLYFRVQTPDPQLYGFVGNTPLNHYDIKGLVFGVTLRRYDGFGGHQYLNTPTCQRGFYPESGYGYFDEGTWIDESKLPRTAVLDYWEWETDLRKRGKLKAGQGAGKPCICASESEVLDCLDKFTNPRPTDDRFNFIIRNCRVMSKRALTACCLKKGSLIHSPANNTGGPPSSGGNSTDW